jgi:hypothetical protein
MPVEQVAVTFFDLLCLTVRDADGSIYLSIGDICAAIGVNRSSQMRRLRNHRQLVKGLKLFRVRTAGGLQDQEFLHLQMTAAWLMSIGSARTGDPERQHAVRERLDYLQLHLIDEVYRAFARLTGLPESGAAAIEDLDDLRRIDPTIAALAERMGAMEQSQDRARDAWRSLRVDLGDLATRVQALEQKVGGSITKAQRGYIYQLVQAWAAARAEREPRLSRSAAYAACWAIVKRKYQLASYEDLPSGKYADCIAFIKNAYRQVMGEDLNLPEQSEMDLGHV